MEVKVTVRDPDLVRAVAEAAGEASRQGYVVTWCSCARVGMPPLWSVTVCGKVPVG